MKMRATPVGVFMIAAVLLQMVLCGPVVAAPNSTVLINATEEIVNRAPGQADTLTNLLTYKAELESELKAAKKALRQASHAVDKDALAAEIRDLQVQLNTVDQNFVKVATGIDESVFSENNNQSFEWREEIETLVRPLLHELKEMTKRPRQIERLKSRVVYFESMLPSATEAVENIDRLIASAESAALKKELKSLKNEFVQRKVDLSNQLDVARFELNELQKEKQSFLESTTKVMAVFFKSRGKNIALAILAFVGVFLFFRLVDRGCKRFLPAFKAKERPFYVRLIEVGLVFMTVIAATVASLFTLYLSGDWFLLSIAIIFIFGALWTAREGFTRNYEQVKLMLNLGAARENERIIHNGVPWRVDSLQLYSTLSNPALSPSRIRLPIGQLIDVVSRPLGRNEPWFPCQIDDWVILSDGIRGKVVSQSPDMVELVQRGGAYVTYQTGDFLALSPKNLSRNFRLKSVFGIDYNLQSDSTSTILAQTKEFVRSQIEKDGYEKSLLNLLVEFESAGASSLNIVIITDFNGDVAHIYGRLERALQRYSVDACTKYGWTIPFSQLVIHQGE